VSGSLIEPNGTNASAREVERLIVHSVGLSPDRSQAMPWPSTFGGLTVATHCSCEPAAERFMT
jgi:hypothetical protein